MKEFSLINKRNQEINILEPNFSNIPKGILIHVHGIGSHFQPVFDSIDELDNRNKLFSTINLKSFGLEFHGHGKSDGLKCCIYSFIFLSVTILVQTKIAQNQLEINQN
jgi:hypothetical protein